MQTQRMVSVVVTCMILWASEYTPARSIVSWPQPYLELPASKKSKTISKEVRFLRKQGWRAALGWPSIEEQLNHYHQMEAELDSAKSEVYLFSSQNCIDRTYNDAKAQAKELAMQELAGTIQTWVTGKSETLLKSIHADNVEQSMSVMKQVTRLVVMQELRDLIPVMEIFRQLPDGEFEVHVRWACSKQQADLFAEEVVRKIKDYQIK